MLKSLNLRNFRSFTQKEFNLISGINTIIGKNGAGKTNILESINLLCSGKNIFNIPYLNLVKKSENVFFITGEFSKSENSNITSSISFDKSVNKKNFFINTKKTTKSNFYKNSSKSVIFTPLIMNMLYLSPSLRRDFLDTLLSSSFDIYEKIIKKYNTILKNRNKLLKDINSGKSKKEDLSFWNTEFIKYAEILYKYRENIFLYIQSRTNDFLPFFDGKVKKIEFKYKTKLDFSDIKKSLTKNILEKTELDILLGRTSIGPHLDDFEILLDDIPIINFASRGEVKTLIIGLKFLEIDYIEKFTNRKPILLIDDLLSELDDLHKKMILKKISKYQSIITSIFPIEGENINQIII